MASKDQLRKVASKCSHYDNQMNNTMSFQSSTSSQSAEKSCERCSHFKNHKCDLDLENAILSNLAEVEYDQKGDL